MTNKDRIESAIVGGATGLTIVACYIVATSVIANVEAKDWLAFGGVVIGVILTISGTLTIDFMRKRAATRRTAEEALKAIKILRETISGIVQDTNEQPSKYTAINITLRFALHQIGRVESEHALIMMIREDIAQWWEKNRVSISTSLKNGDIPAKLTHLETSAEQAHELICQFCAVGNQSPHRPKPASA